MPHILDNPPRTIYFAPVLASVFQSCNHCTAIGNCGANSLRSSASFVAKTSRPPKLRHSQKRKQPSRPESGAARCRTGGKNADFRTVIWRAAMVSDTRCARGGGGYGLVFDRIYRINRIEGRREERGRRGNHAEGTEGERKLRLVARLR